jgi:hypothetical protein
MTRPVKSPSVSRKFFPNLLLICGSGRGTGKTLLACNIIEQSKNKENIVAMKISMHAHEHSMAMELILAGTGYSVWKENSVSEKDSGRFLNAGAQTVHYIETDDGHLYDSFLSVISLLPDHSLIICESGGLSKYVKPGVLLYIREQDYIPDDHKTMMQNLADKIIFSGSDEILQPGIFLTFENSSWKLI